VFKAEESRGGKMGDLLLLIIVFLLIVITYRLSKIDERFKERFPTEKEAEQQGAASHPPQQVSHPHSE
jgi:hypothetical protein